MGYGERSNPRAVHFVGTQTVLDSRGRVLQEGDEIILHLNQPVFVRVAKIAPVLDPAAPPGAVQVQLAAVYQFTVKGNVPVGEFHRVRTADEPPTTETA